MIEYFAIWTGIIAMFFLGYFHRRAFEISKRPPTFKYIIDGPIAGGTLNGRYVVKGKDNNILYVHPPFILTLEK